MSGPRVLIADDHPMYRDGLRLALESSGRVRVVGVADGGAAAVELAARLRPDVVVMDLAMPGVDGVEATRRILSAASGAAASTAAAGAVVPGVLVLTMHDDDEHVLAAMLAGARGYLVKGAGQQEIVRAVEVVHGGDVIFGAALAGRVASYFAVRAGADARGGAGPGDAAGAAALPRLTARERQVLELIAAGLSNAQIAGRLGLASKTVRNNVCTILAKLQVADREAAATVAARSPGLGRGFDR
ncbi:response regulator transcription factor [Actinomadura parmotrematis]|uniref:Response regulator transcription factor n=1 Tax=Actinomadura parmotrematis TaxID=2864039 RepID=A0ABS7FR89_9ACTN|nr:response regulator transcription factor [Actinomadura parmotrematis]MBW8482740.1 response regulator transcription factor [Actinomadura parmotrematis]